MLCKGNFYWCIGLSQPLCLSIRCYFLLFISVNIDLSFIYLYLYLYFWSLYLVNIYLSICCHSFLFISVNIYLISILSIFIYSDLFIQSISICVYLYIVDFTYLMSVSVYFYLYICVYVSTDFCLLFVSLSIDILQSSI